MIKKAKFILGSMPIGNPKDITIRVIDAIKKADLIICENLSFFKKTLQSIDIKTNTNILQFTGNMENGSEITLTELLIKDQSLKILKTGGTVLYISDEGMPGINDPGQSMAKFIFENGYKVDVLPGPSVSTTAFLHSLVFSSSKVTSFSFLMIKNDMDYQLPALKNMLSFQNIVFVTNPEIFNQDMVEKLIDVVGDRDAVVCHSLTTKNQKITKVKLSKILKYLDYENGPSTVVILADSRI